MSVYRDYDGAVWKEEQSAFGGMTSVPVTWWGTPVDQQITVEAWSGHRLPTLYAPAEIYTAAGAPTDARMLGGMVLTFPRMLSFGEMYRVRSYPLGPPVQAYENVAGQYLQLPRSVPDRVIALARSLRSSSPRTLDLLEAVRRELQARCRYTLAYGSPPGVDPIDHFLFVAGEGNCRFFAGATAVLLRAAGIPTRVVGGFHAGRASGGEVVLRDTELHAWTDVYMDGRWWLMDATPAGDDASPGAAGDRMRPEGVAAPRSGSGRGRGSASGWRDQHPQQQAQPQPPQQPQSVAPRPEAGPERAPAASVRRPAVATRPLLALRWQVRGLQRSATVAVASAGSRVPWLLVLLAAVLLLALLAAARMRRSRPAARPCAAEIVASRYRVLTKRLCDAGVPREKSETAREYLERVQRELGPVPAFQEATEHYLCARYGAAREDDELWDELESRLERDLAARQPPA
jgi:hypothetical protein